MPTRARREAQQRAAAAKAAADGQADANAKFAAAKAAQTPQETAAAKAETAEAEKVLEGKVVDGPALTEVPAPDLTATPDGKGGVTVTPAAKPCNKISAHNAHDGCPGVPVVERVVEANGGQPTAGTNRPAPPPTPYQQAERHHKATHKQGLMKDCRMQECKDAVAARPLQPVPAAPATPARKPAGAKMSVKDRIALLVPWIAGQTGATFTRKQAAEFAGCSETVIKYVITDAAPTLKEAGLTVTEDKGTYTVAAK